jgi:hypothetical protein
MYFAYFDESGDSGYEKSPTSAFVLACILVPDAKWLDMLDGLVEHRRYLRRQFGISPRVELKATWLVHNTGSFRRAGLPFRARMAVYRSSMRFIDKCGCAKTFAVLINKPLVKKRDVAARAWAWTYAIERLERFGTSEQANAHILPDEGHGQFIKKKLREMRRFHYVPSAFGTEALERKAANIVEDSSDRRSGESFFIQLADLAAYAAYRKCFPGEAFDGSFWDELGDARIVDVNLLSGGPPGIKVWPRES